MDDVDGCGRTSLVSSRLVSFRTCCVVSGCCAPRLHVLACIVIVFHRPGGIRTFPGV